MSWTTYDGTPKTLPHDTVLAVLRYTHAKTEHVTYDVLPLSPVSKIIIWNEGDVADWLPLPR